MILCDEPIVVDLRNSPLMFDFNILARKRGCESLSLLAVALMLSKLSLEGQEVPDSLPLESLPVAKPHDVGLGWLKGGQILIRGELAIFLKLWSEERQKSVSIKNLIVESMMRFLRICSPNGEEIEAPDEFDQPLNLTESQYLLTEEAKLVLSILVPDDCSREDFIVKCISESYTAVYGNTSGHKSPETVLFSDQFVDLSLGLCEQLDALAEFQSIPREIALHLVLQFAWDKSRHSENVQLFVP
ncbi:MAG: hypothetical protein NTW50_00910 [Candidatus Berkelbacteria bacterium]|nr:hypothetical protein [Candidatus Berkelbacteria bacterium]